MDNTTKLMVCPYCGKLPELKQCNDIDKYFVFHECDEMNFIGKVSNLSEKLIYYWNEHCENTYIYELGYHKDTYIKLLARKIVENSRRYKDAK